MGAVDAQRFLDLSIDKPLIYFTVFRFFAERGFMPAPHYVQAFSKMFPIGAANQPTATTQESK